VTADTRPSILTLLARRPVLGVLLFGLNVWLVRELFGTEYLRNRDSIEAAKDALGLMVIDPGCEGHREIRMVRDRGAGMTVVQSASRASLFGLVARVLPGPRWHSAEGWA